MIDLATITAKVLAFTGHNRDCMIADDGYHCTCGCEDTAKEFLALVAELRAAREVVESVRGSMPYLDGTIGPCETDCDCLLHDLHATLDAYATAVHRWEQSR